MANPLLTLAPTSDGMPATAKSGVTSSVNQSVKGPSHPFAHLLAEQAPAPKGGNVVTAAATDGELSGNLTEHILPVDGNVLPEDALATGVVALLPEDAGSEPALATDPSSSDLTTELMVPTVAMAGQEVEQQAVSAGLSETPATEAPQETDPAAVMPVVTTPDASSPAAKGPTPVSDAVQAVVRQRDPDQRVPQTPVRPAGDLSEAGKGEGPQLPLQSNASTTAHNVTVAVQMALAQRQLRGDQMQGASDSVRHLVSASPASGDSAAQPGGLLNSGAVLPASPSTPQAPTPANMPLTTVMTPVLQPGWDDAVGERVQWMIGQKMQGAEIRLNPAHLGPMEVRISVQNDQTNIAFTAQHGVTRDALEAALPRLRDMLGESGLNLGDVNVSDQSFAEQRRDGGTDSAGDQGTTLAQETGAENELQTTWVTPLREGAGGIDLFA